MGIIEKEQDLFSNSFNVNVNRNENNHIEGHDEIMELFSSADLPNDEKFFIKTESYVLKYAYVYNKLLSLSNSRTRILAYQVDCTDRIISSLKHRFLIADEVGLGKTIEAGLVLKELICRYNYSRVLIVTPATLLYQWQNELESKFNEHFVIMDRKALNKIRSLHGSNINPWKHHNKIICSIDFIKNESIVEEISGTSWDAVIFDEVHRLRRDTRHITLAYSVAEIISKRTKSLLLLSATPFRGKLEELYFLIALIDKNILGPINTFLNDYCFEDSNLSSLKRKIDPVVIRRTKKEVGGFTQRFARTIKFELYPDERKLYDETTAYVVEEFNRALQEENRAVGFVMTVFQKLLDSSSHALKSALKNRIKKLTSIIENSTSRSEPQLPGPYNFDMDYIDETESLDELTGISLEKTISGLKSEVKRIRQLIEIADKISENKKGESLKKLVKTLKKKGFKKILIFTQFRNTQDYLCDLLVNYDVAIFNGSLNKDQKEEAIIRFKNKADILIATEAGGEGRNMQFCNVIINYDLPWSPLKVEQRIGRIHRFGQKVDVSIYNFSTKDTVAERILDVLTRKLKLFEESFGVPDLMLGQIEDELKLGSLFIDIASGNKKKKEIESIIDHRIVTAKKSYEKLSDLMVTNSLDFNYDDYYKITEKERRFTNMRIESFANRMMEIDDFASQYIGQKNKKTDLYRIKSVPNEKNSFGKHGTFKSEVALNDDKYEFLAFGHDIVDKIIDHCQGERFGGCTGIRFIKLDSPFVEVLFNFLVSFNTVSQREELFPVIITCENSRLTDQDVEDIERESIEQDYLKSNITEKHDEIIEEIVENSAVYFKKAADKIIEKVESRVADLRDDLEFQVYPEIEKIKDSYGSRLKELNEKLEVYESKMKLYGSDMKSVITRTKNEISATNNEMIKMLSEYNNYSSIQYSVKLLNAGIIIGL